jgi:hypothetical protein
MVGASAALLAHAQIELTPVHAGSAPLLLMLLGTLWCDRTQDPEHPSSARWPRVAGPVVLAAVASVMAWTGLRPLLAWEGHLRDASAPMVEAGRALRLDPNQPAERVLGPARRMAVEELGRAVDARPHHTTTRIEASRLALQNAVSVPDEASRWLDSARGWVLGSGDESLDARSLRWLAVIERVAVEQGLADEEGVARARQIELLLAASELDPYNAPLARLIAEAHDGVGDVPEAAAWARRALRLDENLRLDPLKRFTADERAGMQIFADGG